MTHEDRIASLKAQHQALDDVLHTKQTQPHPDDTAISTLKKQKLRIKDEIATISRH